jgi:hypothetical protein
VSGLFPSLVARAAGQSPAGTPVLTPRPVSRFEPDPAAVTAALDAEPDTQSDTWQFEEIVTGMPDQSTAQPAPPPARATLALDATRAEPPPPTAARSPREPAFVPPSAVAVTFPAASVRQDAARLVPGRAPESPASMGREPAPPEIHETQPMLLHFDGPTPDTAAARDPSETYDPPPLRAFDEPHALEARLAQLPTRREEGPALAERRPVAAGAPAVSVSIGRIEVEILPAPAQAQAAARPGPQRSRGFAGYEDVRRGRR